MSYIVADTNGMGFIDEAASAAGSIVGGAIELASNIGLLRQQRRDAAAIREDVWAAEFGQMQYDRYIEAQNAEVLAAQNAVAEEHAQFIEEQERIVGLERQALQAEIRRGELEAERRAREEAAMSFKMPTWGWVALAGVGIAIVIGAGAYAGAQAGEG
ncbi:MAG: hypothetical protein ACYTFQ_17435 [Planctomycetota bacterium]|jgi:hypothetical protein